MKIRTQPMFYFALYLFCSSILHAGRGEVEEKVTNQPVLNFCRRTGFETDDEYFDCVRGRRWKRHDGRYRSDNPCGAYVKLTSVGRRVGNIITDTSSPLCDINIPQTWYRFVSPAGGEIPDVCPPPNACGTISPIWIKDPHPTRPYDETIVRVCARGDGCCDRNWSIKVVNCVNYYVYQLISPPMCYMAYCAGRESPCPEGTNSLSGFTPECTKNFPALPGKAVLKMSYEEPDIKFYCDYKGRIMSESALYVDWFVAGDKSGDEGSFEIPVWTDEMIERRRSVLTEGRWVAKMGSTVFCRIRAKWRNNTGVFSRPIDSEKYFAGIKVLHRVLNVSESGGIAQIQLKSTVPIKCLPEFEDSCMIAVEVDYNPDRSDDLYASDYDNEQIVFGDCSVEITSDNWEQVHNITVKAVRDFRTDGNKRMLVSFKPIFTTVASDMWNNYRLPSVEVISTDSLTGVCSSYGDPHLRTFDGLLYHIYVEGEFILYQNTKYQMKVHTRMEKCTETATCNCGLAVAVNDDIIVVDRCHRRMRNVAFGKSFPEGWNTLHRHALEQGASFVQGLRIFEHDEGRKYTIHTPTGAYVNFEAGEKWVNIQFHASSDDYQSTLGLCGTFDDIMSNDFTLADGRTMLKAGEDEECGNSTNVCRFINEYRVKPDQSLFGNKVNITWSGAEFLEEEKFCICERGEASSVVTCGYQKDVSNPESLAEQRYGVDKTEEIMIHGRGSRSKRSLGSNDYDDYFHSEFLYDEHFHGHLTYWPTPSGITELEAGNKCREAIFQNSAATNCYQLFSDYERKEFVDSCVADIKLSDGYGWIKSSLEPFISLCINKVYTSSTMWHPTTASKPKPSSVNKTRKTSVSRAQQFLKDICPNACSQKGRCVERRCQCQQGFEGSDCSIDSSTLPKNLRSFGQRLCDVRISGCSSVVISGDNFQKKDNITCSFFESNSRSTTKTTAHFITFEEISCPLPPFNLPFNKYGLSVEILNKSFSMSVGNYTRFDSKCVNCSLLKEYSHCSFQKNTCSISGKCYADQEKNPNNCCEVCNPSVSSKYFVKRKVPDLTFEPEESELYLNACHSAAVKFIEITPKFECGISFDVKWPEISCFNLLKFSTTGSSIFVKINKCQWASCPVQLLAKPECPGKNFTKLYTIHLIGVPDEYSDACQGIEAQIMNGTDVEWVVTPNNIHQFDFSTKNILDGDVSYSIIKNSHADIRVTQDGMITYKAPDGPEQEVVTVVINGSCSRVAFTKMMINVKA